LKRCEIGGNALQQEIGFVRQRPAFADGRSADDASADGDEFCFGLLLEIDEYALHHGEGG
jgi:hypothetical protein